MIGDAIEVMVLDIRGDKVRIGIVAPRDISVHRKEVYKLVKEAEAAAAGSAGHGSMPQAQPNGQPVPIPNDAFMQAAIDEARLGQSEGGLPIGSVLVRQGQIIGRGHNRRVQKGDPMAHAEIDCLTNAGRQKSYKDTALYSTLMPCHLCSGAVLQFGIPRVVVGDSKNFSGAPGVLRKQGIEVVDLHDPQCISMMADFIKAHPDLWNEDIGRLGALE
jgi:cytosine deaminase